MNLFRIAPSDPDCGAQGILEMPGRFPLNTGEWSQRDIVTFQKSSGKRQLIHQEQALFPSIYSEKSPSE